MQRREPPAQSAPFPGSLRESLTLSEPKGGFFAARLTSNPCNSDRSRSASDGAVEEPAVSGPRDGLCWNLHPRPLPLTLSGPQRPHSSAPRLWVLRGSVPAGSIILHGIQNALDMTDTASVGPAAPTPPTRLRKTLANIKRVLTLASVVLAVYLLVGCWMFPDWWYSWLWQRQFADPEYTAEGLHVLLDQYFSLVLTIIFLVLAVAVLGRIFRDRLFRIVDAAGGIIALGSWAAVLVTFLFLYHTYHSDQMNPLDDINELSERVQNQLRFIYTSPVIGPPIDFDYINKERVDALYNQLEPELEEKERTVAQNSTDQAKVGAAGGGISAEVTKGKGASSTSSFSRTHFSQERECIEVMKYIADTSGSAKYFATRERWIQNREAADGILDMQQKETAAILNRFRVSLGLQPTPESAKKPTEAERRAKREKILASELHDLQGLVFLDGIFSKSATNGDLTLLEQFSTAPPKVYFRVHIPKIGKADIPARGVLRVFGDVLRPLDAEGYIDIRAIAIY
jgi:hypothetical protein